MEKKAFIDVDALLPQVSLEQAATFYGVALPELKRVGNETRTRCFLDRRWQATPYARFERLLRETRVPIGLLANGTHLRLVYAPRGETAGHLTFPVVAMTEVAGRPIFAALHMLLCADRVFTLSDKQRLPSILVALARNNARNSS